MEVVPRLDNDKFQAMTRILADAIRAYFSGASPPSLVIQTHACRQIIHDLAAFYANPRKVPEGVQPIRRIEFPSKRTLMRGKSDVEQEFRNIANNLRHADKNTNEVYPTPFAIAHSYLAVTILDYLELKKNLEAADIIRQRDIKSYADIGVDWRKVKKPVMLGSLKLFNRPIIKAEEEENFRYWKPIVDRLSGLFIQWHVATQPRRAYFNQTTTLPVNIRLSKKTKKAIGKAMKLASDSIYKREYEFPNEDHRHMALSAMVRYGARRAMVNEMDRYGCGYKMPHITDYYMVRVNMPDQGQSSGTVSTVPFEGQHFYEDKTPIERRFQKLGKYELRLAIST